MSTEKVVKASGNWRELYLLAHTQQDESTKHIESISKKELPGSSSLRNLKELIEQQSAGSAASSEELLPMSRAVAEVSIILRHVYLVPHIKLFIVLL